MPFGGVRKLPDNHLVVDLMETVGRRRPLSHAVVQLSCDVCRGPVAAGAGSARCLDCCKSLCGGCAAAHRRTAVTAAHSLYDPDLVAAVLQVNARTFRAKTSVIHRVTVTQFCSISMPVDFCRRLVGNDNDNEREFIQRVVVNKSRTR